MAPFDLASLSKEKEELEAEMGKEGFWNDVENANKVNRRMKAISSKLDKYSHLMARCEDLETLIEMADEETTKALCRRYRASLPRLKRT